MGGLVIADFAIQYTGIYELNPYVKVPVEFVCRVGHALGFVWVFLFTGKARGHLSRKYPESFGKVFEALGQGTMSETRATNSAVTASCDGLGQKTTRL